MPRGWYLAQGLVPLGYSSSDDDEGPCELPNGRLVCGPHGLVRCGICCSDYSFMDDVLGEDIEDNEEDDEDHDFRHPTSPLRPMELFRGRVRFMNIVRCTYPNDKSMLLIMTDGACLNNGQSNPKAGRLEKQGPWGDDGIQSSNRAELRAVIAALRFRHWPGEGFSTVIIATDSEYVVEGSTQWAKAWVQNNWRTKGKKGIGGGNVKNKDLWEMLLGCEKAHRNGLVIQFWKIPRQWNALADEGAKNAAAAEETPVEWKDCLGLAI
ncbi:RNase H domain-containing protein [Hirsutella rhossiliensis]|uniref:ribonuclease H n=1 Tax=Hirsutella rhossiliensis TaxID=111463 RepID=A0A9P8N2E2_9HYPO|nr:RNase H domain-containing protein [Hirsutella rhossiliensis]KAH0965362.1 RNase H domain-containing protein [Hirsutella rhossiliensis]